VATKSTIIITTTNGRPHTAKRNKEGRWWGGVGKNTNQAANSTPNLCRAAASVVNNNLRDKKQDDAKDNNRKQQQ